MQKYTARVKLSGPTVSQGYRLLVRNFNREDGKKERRGEEHHIPSKQTLFVGKIKKKHTKLQQPLAVSSQAPQMTKDKNP